MKHHIFNHISKKKWMSTLVNDLWILCPLFNNSTSCHAEVQKQPPKSLTLGIIVPSTVTSPLQATGVTRTATGAKFSH